MNQTPRILACYFFFGLLAAAGTASAQPSISAIENNYSYILPYSPNYGIAERPIFTISDRTWRPATLHSASISVNVSQFGVSPVRVAKGLAGRYANEGIMHADVVKLMTDEMNKRGIQHTTSECTLRGFTCGAKLPLAGQ